MFILVTTRIIVLYAIFLLLLFAHNVVMSVVVYVSLEVFSLLKLFLKVRRAFTRQLLVQTVPRTAKKIERVR
jgi:hypothetical protein